MVGDVVVIEQPFFVESGGEDLFGVVALPVEPCHGQSPPCYRRAATRSRRNEMGGAPGSPGVWRTPVSLRSASTGTASGTVRDGRATLPSISLSLMTLWRWWSMARSEGWERQVLVGHCFGAAHRSRHRTTGGRSRRSGTRFPAGPGPCPWRGRRQPARLRPGTAGYLRAAAWASSAGAPSPTRPSDVAICDWLAPLSRSGSGPPSAGSNRDAVSPSIPCRG